MYLPAVLWFSRVFFPCDSIAAWLYHYYRESSLGFCLGRYSTPAQQGVSFCHDICGLGNLTLTLYIYMSYAYIMYTVVSQFLWGSAAYIFLVFIFHCIVSFACLSFKVSGLRACIYPAYRIQYDDMSLHWCLLSLLQYSVNF